MLFGLASQAQTTAWPAENPLAPTLTAVPGGLAAAQQHPDAAPAVAAWPLMPLEGKQMFQEPLAMAAVAGLVWTQLWIAHPQLWCLEVVGGLQLIARQWQLVS